MSPIGRADADQHTPLHLHLTANDPWRTFQGAASSSHKGLHDRIDEPTNAQNSDGRPTYPRQEQATAVVPNGGSYYPKLANGTVQFQQSVLNAAKPAMVDNIRLTAGVNTEDADARTAAAQVRVKAAALPLVGRAIHLLPSSFVATALSATNFACSMEKGSVNPARATATALSQTRVQQSGTGPRRAVISAFYQHLYGSIRLSAEWFEEDYVSQTRLASRDPLAKLASLALSDAQGGTQWARLPDDASRAHQALLCFVERAPRLERRNAVGLDSLLLADLWPGESNYSVHLRRFTTAVDLAATAVLSFRWSHDRIMKFERMQAATREANGKILRTDVAILTLKDDRRLQAERGSLTNLNPYLRNKYRELDRQITPYQNQPAIINNNETETRLTYDNNAAIAINQSADQAQIQQVAVDLHDLATDGSWSRHLFGHRDTQQMFAVLQGTHQLAAAARGLQTAKDGEHKARFNEDSQTTPIEVFTRLGSKIKFRAFQAIYEWIVNKIAQLRARVYLMSIKTQFVRPKNDDEPAAFFDTITSQTISDTELPFTVGSTFKPETVTRTPISLQDGDWPAYLGTEEARSTFESASIALCLDLSPVYHRDEDRALGQWQAMEAMLNKVAQASKHEQADDSARLFTEALSSAIGKTLTSGRKVTIELKLPPMSADSQPGSANNEPTALRRLLAAIDLAQRNIAKNGATCDEFGLDQAVYERLKTNLTRAHEGGCAINFGLAFDDFCVVAQQKVNIPAGLRGIDLADCPLSEPFIRRALVLAAAAKLLTKLHGLKLAVSSETAFYDEQLAAAQQHLYSSTDVTPLVASEPPPNNEDEARARLREFQGLCLESYHTLNHLETLRDERQWPGLWLAREANKSDPMHKLAYSLGKVGHSLLSHACGLRPTIEYPQGVDTNNQPSLLQPLSLMTLLTDDGQAIKYFKSQKHAVEEFSRHAKSHAKTQRGTMSALLMQAEATAGRTSSTRRSLLDNRKTILTNICEYVRLSILRASHKTATDDLSQLVKGSGNPKALWHCLQIAQDYCALDLPGDGASDDAQAASELTAQWQRFEHLCAELKRLVDPGDECLRPGPSTSVLPNPELSPKQWRERLIRDRPTGSAHNKAARSPKVA